MKEQKSTVIGVMMSGDSVLSVESSPKAKTNTAKVEQTSSTGTPYVTWGETNDLPTQVIAAMSKNEILARANEFNCNVHIGSGVGFYKEIKKDGRRYIEYFDDSEIADWLLANEVNEYLYKAFVQDYETLGNFNPELILSTNRQKIARVYRHDASWCRWEKQDQTLRDVKQLYVNANWESYNDKFTEKIPVLPTRNPIESLTMGKGYNYAFRIRPVTTGRYYYEMCNTEIMINSGTLAIASDIKRTMRALLKNQTNLRWHIQISDEYLKSRFGENEWLKISSDAEKRNESIKEVKTEIDNYLAGTDNAGKTLMTGFYYDKSGNKKEGVIINPLKNEILKGEWIPDQMQLANEIFMGMGVDPSAVGGFANQNRTMNSGSEKKNSFAISETTFASDQMITLSWLVFVARYNGWFKRIPELKFGVLPPATEKIETPAKA